MTILQNIAEFQDAWDAVESHCMCARMTDDGSKITIFYPEGACSHRDGLRVDRNAVMLRRAAEIMETDWKESFP